MDHNNINGNDGAMHSETLDDADELELVREFVQKWMIKIFHDDNDYKMAAADAPAGNVNIKIKGKAGAERKRKLLMTLARGVVKILKEGGSSKQKGRKKKGKVMKRRIVKGQANKRKLRALRKINHKPHKKRGYRKKKLSADSKAPMKRAYKKKKAKFTGKCKKINKKKRNMGRMKDTRMNTSFETDVSKDNSEMHPSKAKD